VGGGRWQSGYMTASERAGNNYIDLKGFRSENGSSQGHNLACVPDSLDRGTNQHRQPREVRSTHGGGPLPSEEGQT